MRYAETDRMGVVYHSHYLVWCEIGRTDHIRSLGTTYRELEQEGVTLAVTEASVRYLAPARYDDVVRVRTSIGHAGSRTVDFDYVITNAATGTRLATAFTRLISLDRDGRVVALPRELRASFARDAAAPA